MKIFDGYNLIGAGSRLGLDLSLEDKEERLLTLLAAYRSRRRITSAFLVVFDGGYGRLAEGPKTFTRRGIRVEYAVGESADDVIVRRLRKSSDPRGTEVVTSDREVLAKVRQARGKGTRSGDFLAVVAEALQDDPVGEKPGDPSDDEVKEWLTLFGEDDEG